MKFIGTLLKKMEARYQQNRLYLTDEKISLIYKYITSFLVITICFQQYCLLKSYLIRILSLVRSLFGGFIQKD